MNTTKPIGNRKLTIEFTAHGGEHYNSHTHVAGYGLDKALDMFVVNIATPDGSTSRHSYQRSSVLRYSVYENYVEPAPKEESAEKA